MAGTVDERIVEARFDASDFEKGVDRTVKKLDELKKSLNLESAGKSVADFAKDANDGIEKAGNALQRLSDRFTTFKGMVKQQILGGIANEISSAFLRVEQSLLRFTKSISTDQISAGMSKYTEILNSVRTMTAAGVGQDIAYDKIKRLAEYSDQTSYSLSQMTSGMSKLVAAGMKVDAAEKSMEGLANMAASAGVNIYDAQRAFLNFSQAYGSGKMRIQDWMSFENLNMATEPIMKVFMQAAEEVGTLKKSVDKSGKEIYKTAKTTANKLVTANKEVKTSGFRDTLSFGWLDKEVMEKATAVLSYFEDLGMNMNELSDEDLKNFAAKAFQSAKEARSFADVMGTLKDVVATGWATSFELIFGKLDQATDFFTWLTESKVAEAIYSVGEFRNEVLKAWSQTYEGFDEDGNLIGGLWKDQGELSTGRDYFIKGLHVIDDILGSIHNTIIDLFPSENNSTLNHMLTLPQMIGKTMGEMSVKFYHATETIRDFFTVVDGVDDEGKPIYKLAPEFASIAQAVASTFGIVNKFSNIFQESISKVAKATAPIFKALAGSIGKALNPLNELNGKGGEDFFNNITMAIDNFLTMAQPAFNTLEKIAGLIGDVVGFFVGMAIDTAKANIEWIADGLGLLVELFGGKSAQKTKEGVGIIEGWRNSIVAFGDSCKEAIGKVTTFFHDLFDQIRQIFGLGEYAEQGPMEGGFFKNILDFFNTNEFIQSILGWFKQLPKKIEGGLKKLGKTARGIWNSITDFLFGKKVSWNTFDGKQWKTVTTRIKSGFSLWLDNTVKDIGKWITTDLPNNVKDIWNNILDFFLGRRTGNIVKDPETGREMTERVKEGFSKWLSDTVESVKGWFGQIPGKLKELWQTVYNYFFQQDQTIEVKDPETGTIETKVVSKFGKIVENVKEAVGNFYQTHKDSLKEIYDSLRDFFFKKNVDAVTGETVSDQDLESGQEYVTGFQRVVKKVKDKVTAWLNESGAVNFAKDLWGKVKDFFFKDNIDSATGQKVDAKEAGKTYITGFKNVIKRVVNKVKTYLEGSKAIGFLTDLYGKIHDFFFLKTEEIQITDPETGNVEVKLVSKFQEIVGNVVRDVKQFIAVDMPKKVSGLWNALLDGIFGNKQEKIDLDHYNELMEQGKLMDAKEYAMSFKEHNDIIGDKTRELVTQLGEKIAAAFKDLPGTISRSVQNKTDLLKNLFEHITEKLHKFNEQNQSKELAKDTGKKAKDIIDEANKEVEKEVGEESESDGLIQAITGAIEPIIGFVKESVPAFLSEAWTAISSESSKLWDAIVGIFSENFDWQVIQGKVTDIATDIAEYIKQLPSEIQKASNGLKSLLQTKSPLEEAQEQLIAQFENGEISEMELERKLNRAAKTLSDKPRNFLWEAIKEIGGSIGDAFLDLGPAILNGLNSALEWVSKGFDWATGFLHDRDKNEPILDSLGKALDKEESIGTNTALGQAFANIGSTIANLATDIIPSFIQEAIEELKVQIPKMFDKLFSFDFFGSKEQEEVKEFANQAGEATEEVQKAFEEAGVTKKTENQPGFLDWVSGWLISGAGAEGAEGAEAAVEQLNTALDKNNKALSQTESKMVERNKMIQILDEQYMQAEKTKTLTRGVEGKGEQYDEAVRIADLAWKYSKEIQALPKEITEVDSTKYTIEATKSVEQTNTVIESIFSLLGNVASGGSQILGVAAVIWGISFAISQIKELLSISDELEAPGYSAKWQAIEIAIMGILGVLAWTSYLTMTGQDTELQNAWDTLDKVAAFVEKVAWAIGVVVAVCKGIDVVEALAGGSSGGSSVLASFFGGVVGGAGFAAISDLIGSTFESLFQSLSNIFETIGVGANNFITQIKPTVNELVELGDQLGPAIQAIDQIGELINHFYGAVAIVSNPSAKVKGPYGQTLDNSLEVMYNFEKMVGFINASGTFTHNLSRALNILNQMSTDEINEAMTKLATLVGSDKFYNIMQAGHDQAKKFGDEFGGSALSASSVAISSVANSLAIFGDSMSGVDMNSLTVIGMVFDTFNRLADSLNEFESQTMWSKIFTGDNSLSNFGDQIQRFSANMVAFFGNVVSIRGKLKPTNAADKTVYEDVRKVIDMIAQAASGLGIALQYIDEDNTDNFEKLSEKLPGIAEHIGTFMEKMRLHLSTDISLEDFQKFELFASGLRQMMEALNRAETSSLDRQAQYLAEYDWYKYLSPVRENILTALGTDTLYQVGYDVGAELGHGILVSGLEAADELRLIFQLLESTTPDTIFTGKFKDSKETLINNINAVIDKNIFKQSGESAGSYLDAGLADGISTGKSLAAATELAEAIKAVFPEKWDENSPSVVGALYGKFLDLGLAKGIAESSRVVTDNAEQVATDTLKSFEGVLGDYVPKESMADHLIGQVSSKDAEKAATKTANVMNSLLSTFYPNNGSLMSRIVYGDDSVKEAKETTKKTVNVFGSTIEQAASKTLGEMGGSLLSGFASSASAETEEFKDQMDLQQETMEAGFENLLKTREDFEEEMAESRKDSPSLFEALFGDKNLLAAAFGQINPFKQQAKKVAETVTEETAEAIQNESEKASKVKKITGAANVAFELAKLGFIVSNSEQEELRQETEKTVTGLVADTGALAAKAFSMAGDKFISPFVSSASAEEKFSKKQNWLTGMMSTLWGGYSKFEDIKKTVNSFSREAQPIFNAAGEAFADAAEVFGKSGGDYEWAIGTFINEFSTNWDVLAGMVKDPKFFDIMASLARYGVVIDDTLNSFVTPGTGEFRYNEFAGYMLGLGAQLLGFGEDAGMNLDMGLANGMSGENAIAAAGLLATTIMSIFTTQWDEHSPSRIFEGIGRFLDLGLAKGIEGSSRDVVGSAEDMAQTAISNTTSILETIRNLSLEDMDITPTITPVVDMTNVENAAARLGMFGSGYYPIGLDTTLLNRNAQSANPAWAGRGNDTAVNYSDALSGLRGDISSLGSKIDAVGGKFSGLRVILDSGAVVGGIVSQVDEALGRKGFYAGREG